MIHSPGYLPLHPHFRAIIKVTFETPVKRPDQPAGFSTVHEASPPALGALGSREREVLSVLRLLGSATVQQVANASIPASPTPLS